MKDSKKIIRRRHDPELKAQILSECEQPGASVASVAMSHVRLVCNAPCVGKT